MDLIGKKESTYDLSYCIILIIELTREIYYSFRVQGGVHAVRQGRGRHDHDGGARRGDEIFGAKAVR